MVAARFQSRLFHAVDVVSSYRDDWHVLPVPFELPEASHGLQTIQNGHVQVHKDEIGTLSLCYFESFLAVFSFKNVVAFQLKGSLEHNAGVTRIFSYQDCRIN